MSLNKETKLSRTEASSSNAVECPSQDTYLDNQSKGKALISNHEKINPASNPSSCGEAGYMYIYSKILFIL